MKKLIIVLILMMISSAFAKLNCYDITRGVDKENKIDSTWLVVTFNCVDEQDSIKSTFFIKNQEIVIFNRTTNRNDGKSFKFSISKEPLFDYGTVSNTVIDEFGIIINKIKVRHNKEKIEDGLVNEWNEYKKFLKK